MIYLKGNSKSIKGWGKFAIDFTRMGYDVMMVDYRGFGKSTGKRTEDSIKDDLQYVYDRIKEQVDEKYIIRIKMAKNDHWFKEEKISKPPPNTAVNILLKKLFFFIKIDFLNYLICLNII